MIFFEKLHQVVKAITKWKNKFFQKKQTVYLSILGIFAACFLFISLSPLWLSSGKKYISIELGKPQTFGQTTIEIMDRQYNKDKKLYVETFYIPEQSPGNIGQLFAKTVTKKDPTKNLNTKIKNIDNQMYVLIISNLSSGFGTLKHTITNEGASNLYEYVNETQIPNNPKLKIKKEKDYQVDSVQYDIKRIKQEIHVQEKKIVQLVKDNKKLDNEIDSLKKEMNFQTTEEQEKSISTIKQYESQKLGNNKTIAEKKALIQNRHEKIGLLTKKIFAIKNNKEIEEVEIPTSSDIDYIDDETIVSSTNETDSTSSTTVESEASTSSLALNQLFPNKDKKEIANETN